MDNMEVYSMPTLCLVNPGQEQDERIESEEQSTETQDDANGKSNVQSIDSENKKETTSNLTAVEMDKDLETSLTSEESFCKYESLQDWKTAQRKIIHLEMMKIKRGSRELQHARFLKLNDLLIEVTKANCILEFRQLEEMAEKNNFRK